MVHSLTNGDKVNDISHDSSGDEDWNPKDSFVEVSSVDDMEESEPNSSCNSISCSSSADWPPLTVNEEALKHIATYLLPGSHGKCLDVSSMNGGTFHEIRVLHFEDGWSCIARLSKDKDETLEKMESEIATMKYVKKNTSIPVPEIYLVNYDPEHVVGAAFVLMEMMGGEKLCDIWTKELSLDDRISIVGQLAAVVGELATTSFTQIGSLTSDGSLGHPLHKNGQMLEGKNAFDTTLDFYLARLDECAEGNSESTQLLYQEVRKEAKALFAREDANPILHGPYRLMHGDFDWQNILIQQNADGPPKLTAIIDWDWRYTTPLYHLCEYPWWITDYEDLEEQRNKWANNKILRKHFVATLIQHFPKGSIDREHIRACFREKSYFLNMFERNFFDVGVKYQNNEVRILEEFLRGIRGEVDEDDPDDTFHPYGGIIDWEADSDPELDDE